jgi:hypothetical protein
VPDGSAAALAPRRHRAFWLFWGFDALVAAVVCFFFVWGVVDGSVSSFNITLWLGMLALVAAVVGGSLALHGAGRPAAAFGLLLILAIPGLGMVLFMLAVLILQPRWN